MKPQDLIDMKEVARLASKSKGAVYQWKRAYSFPFRIYKNREGLDSVSRAAVLDWMEENGMSVPRKTRKSSTGQKRVTLAARRGVVAAAEKKRTRVAEEVEDEFEVDAPKVHLPLTDDFPIQFWSKVVDAMEHRGSNLTLTYENGKAVLVRHDMEE